MMRCWKKKIKFNDTRMNRIDESSINKEIYMLYIYSMYVVFGKFINKNAKIFSTYILRYSYKSIKIAQSIN